MKTKGLFIILIPLIFSIMFSTYVYGATYFVEIYNPLGESNVRACAKISNGVAVIGTEESGDIFKTEDSGDSWTKVADYGTDNVDDINVFLRIDANTILAGTSRTAGARILKSIDAGDNWYVADTITDQRVNAFVDMGNGKLLLGTRWSNVAPVGTPSIWKSEDYGDNWTKVTTPDNDEQHIYAMLYLGDGKVLAGVGSNEDQGVNAKIYNSSDYGVTWTKRWDFTNDTTVMDIFNFEYDNSVFAVTRDNGTIWKSIDNGTTWTFSQQIGGGDNNTQLLDLEEMVNGTDHWIFLAIGNVTEGNVAVWRSLDNGTTFTEFDVLRTPAFRDVASCITVIDDVKNIIFVGSGNHDAQARVWRYIQNPTGEEEPPPDNGNGVTPPTGIDLSSVMPLIELAITLAVLTMILKLLDDMSKGFGDSE